MSHSPARRIFWSAWLTGLAVWIGSLALAGPHDLAVSQAVADPHAALARLVETFGEWPAWFVVAGCLFVLLAARDNRPKLSRLRPFAWTILILAIVEPLIITQSLKFLWGRVRFRDLGPEFAGYTAFWIPAGVGAGESFPSGHVAMASVVTPAVFFAGKARGLRTGCVTLLLVLVYLTVVAYARILAGAHYLSDCLFSAGASFLIAALLSRSTIPCDT